MMFQGTPVIILGMGRSGTSYLTHILYINGVSLGSHLLTAAHTNPRGYFENCKILDLHQAILKRLRSSADWDDPLGEILLEPEITPEERERAIAALQQLATPGIWGWKDPRTVHFIELWLELLPQAKLIVPLRHPLEVMYSYLKRVGTPNLFTSTGFFRAYADYHSRIFNVVSKWPNRSLIIYTPNAFSDPLRLSKILQSFTGAADNQWGHHLPEFVPAEFSRFVIFPSISETLRVLMPETMASFEKLNQSAEFRFYPGDTQTDLPASFDILNLVQGINPSTARESWLPLLIDICRPSQSPSYFALQSKWISELLKAKQFWQEQAESRLAALDSHAALFREQTAWIEKLEEAKHFWQQQANR